MPDSIALQIGQENQIKVRNSTGSTIFNGKPVYTTGMTGNRPTVAYAKGDSPTTSRLLGLLTQDIANNADGKVTTSGYVRNIDTTGTPYGETWADGDELWVSKATAGALTKTEPSAPHHSDYVGQVVNSHATQGSILVHISRHHTLENLSDINGTALTTDGQIPNWNNTGGYFDFDKNINSYTPLTTTNLLQSSGVLTGGALSIGTGGAGVATTFTIASGTGQIVDNTVNPTTVTPVSWSAKTDVAVTNILTQLVTFVAIDSGGNVIQSATDFTPAQMREYIVIGVVVHSNQTTVNAVNQAQIVAYNMGNQLTDLMYSMGLFNVSGNIFSANGANLKINKSAGSIFRRGGKLYNPHG